MATAPDHGAIPEGDGAAHPLGFTRPTSPGAIGAGRPWMDTADAASGFFTPKIRNADDSGFLTPPYETKASVAALNARVVTLEAAPSPAFVALTDAATVTWATDGKAVNNAKVTLGGNRTLDITGAVDGATGVLIVTQDGTGSRTLTLPGKKEGGGLTLSTAAGAVDVLAWVYNGTSFFWTLGKGFA